MGGLIFFAVIIAGAFLFAVIGVAALLGKAGRAAEQMTRLENRIRSLEQRIENFSEKTIPSEKTAGTEAAPVVPSAAEAVPAVETVPAAEAVPFAAETVPMAALPEAGAGTVPEAASKTGE